MTEPAVLSPEGPELHLAALPFPTYQGTQAAILSMLEARTRMGKRVELFAYGTRAHDYPLAPAFVLHRSAEWPAISLRSGPSWPKLALDAYMAVQLRALVRRRRPRLLIAHHVEAMSLACAVPELPCVFFAHTDLSAELPTYGRREVTKPLALAGLMLDRALCRKASAIAGISPNLCERLATSSDRRTCYVPTPWPLPEPIRASERAQARLAMGLAADALVALYAGNLDAYQDAERILEALRLVGIEKRRRITLLLATRSDSSAFLRRAVTLGVAFRTCQLGGEPIRRMLHAAADFAIVPRGIPGGLPIKLLDALARGLPCAVMPHATAGLPISDSVLCARAHTTAALAAAITTLASQPGLRRELARRGRRYVASEHTDEHFGRALDAVVAEARELHLLPARRARLR